MSAPPERASLVRRIGWVVFAAEVSALFGYALHVNRAAPRSTGDATTSPDGKRFGITEAQRRAHFAEMTKGEKENREQAEQMKEGVIWNRNHDSYFHQHEWSRILWWSHRLGVPEWQGWLILDEGLRGHWPGPPGVAILADEAPLAPTTRPLAKRTVLAPAPPLPPPPPPKAPPAPAPAAPAAGVPATPPAAPPLKAPPLKAPITRPAK